MGAIIGPYIINGAAPHLEILRKWQPNLALLLDPSADDAAALRAACARTYIVGRIYVPDGEVAQRILANPEEAGDWAHSLIVNQPARISIDSWQIENEVCQFWDELPFLVRYCLRRVQRANEAGYGAAVGGLSVGQLHMPEDDRFAYWRQLDPLMGLLAKQRQHVFVLHQYGAPDLWGPAAKGGADWLLHRLEHQVFPRMPGLWSTVRWAVTEYGIDGGLLRDLGRAVDDDPGVAVEPIVPTAKRAAGSWPGWRSFTTAEKYATDLINVGEYCKRWSANIIGYAVFTLGSNPPWGEFDITGEVSERLASYYATTSPTEPPVVPPVTPPVVPPPTGATMIPEVYDVDGMRRDLIWLKMNYGAWYIAAQGAPGQGVFRLAQIHITEGPAVVKVRVQNQNTGLPNHAVAFYWPNAPDNLVGADFKTIYKPRAAVQWTDSLGYTGYGVGTGSYISDIGIGGPHALWVLHDKCPSDAIDGVGMLPGTEHRGPFDLVFDLRIESISYNTLNDALLGEAEKNDVLPVNPTAALARVGRERELWPTSDEFDVVFDGITYVAQRFREPDTDWVFVFYCVRGVWDKVFEISYIPKNNAG